MVKESVQCTREPIWREKLRQYPVRGPSAYSDSIGGLNIKGVIVIGALSILPYLVVTNIFMMLVSEN